MHGERNFEADPCKIVLNNTFDLIEKVIEDTMFRIFVKPVLVIKEIKTEWN